MLAEAVRGGLITLAVVVILVALGGVAIKVPGAEVGHPTSAASRVLLGLAGAALFAFALINPGKEHFRVEDATLLIKPTTFTGRCPVSVAMVGRLETTGGKGPVTYDFSLPGGPEQPKPEDVTVEGTDAVSRQLQVESPAQGEATFDVLSPDQLTARFEVRYTCHR